MQHVGDLQPVDQRHIRGERAPTGAYSAQRSRWRFMVGSLEIGFDRASEKIHSEVGTNTPGWVQRTLILFGMFCVSLLVIGLVGWLWSARGPVLGGETVSAAIVERTTSDERMGMSALGLSGTPSDKVAAPAAEKPAFLTAVIEKRASAPASAPAPQAAVEIAQGHAFTPRPAQQQSFTTRTPDEAIVASGNFLLIPPVEQAVGIAMQTGEAQNWTAGSYHGVVVVSDVEPKNDKSCRNGTILLRDGTPKGRTQSFERCF